MDGFIFDEKGGVLIDLARSQWRTVRFRRANFGSADCFHTRSPSRILVVPYRNRADNIWMVQIARPVIGKLLL